MNTKAEDRILELLAEYLKKTDQALERIDLAYDVLIKHSEELVELRKSSEKNQQEIVELRKESLDLRKESIKREIQQDVLLKEILSISRRVGALEDKR